jgi:hypothetical protein
MNFIGHAVVAAATDDDAAVLFGSMLPDFATMIGARLGEVRDDAVARGVEHHHATDDAFHGAPIFIELMGEARDELEEAGVSLGPSLAVGHVGVELLLDGWLVEHRGGASLFTRALNRGGDLLHLVEGTRRGGGGAAQPALTELVRRLRESRIPGAYREPEFVADRMRRILDARPRLRMNDAESVEVHAWAERARPRIWARAEALISQVHARLASASSR